MYIVRHSTISYIADRSISDSLPLGSSWDDLDEGCVTLTVKFSLAVQVHDVDFDEATTDAAAHAEVKPRPARRNSTLKNRKLA